MSAGDLSPNAARFVDLVAAGTGLNRTVVVAWVGAETPWGSTKSNHNYLNVGPGQNFTSVEQAANRVVSLITSSPLYAGVRAAIPAGPLAQAKAIEDSPWDAGHYGRGRLQALYTQLAGSAAPTGAPGAPGATPVGFGVPGVGDIAGPVVGKVFELLVPAGLQLLLSTAALGLIALGLVRLTAAGPRKALSDTQGLTGQASQAAGVARLAAL